MQRLNKTVNEEQDVWFMGGSVKKVVEAKSKENIRFLAKQTVFFFLQGKPLPHCV